MSSDDKTPRGKGHFLGLSDTENPREQDVNVRIYDMIIFVTQSGAAITDQAEI